MRQDRSIRTGKQASLIGESPFPLAYESDPDDHEPGQEDHTGLVE
jgi:hypothetical protein